ncbi:hypothetical protein EKD16_03250 [Streptomonospora litoralis]|uniref:Uncharacterized protein n=1 Tax=Streptomonospora litoralis TaxID=2498135 RepID=A0A4P6PZW3_9ACTN|nr:hypothetical protein EKD16_03250 [Streptomonospora litoralis]
MRRHRPRRRPEAPPSYGHSAIRNNAGCFIRQCPIPRWVRTRAAAARAHEARRMAQRTPLTSTFRASRGRCARRGRPQNGHRLPKVHPIGGWGTRRRRPGATSDVSSPPRPPIRPPSGRASAGMSLCRPIRRCIANLWPRNTLSCDHKFTIDGPSRGTGATYCGVSTRQRPQSGGNRAIDAPTGPRWPNAAPRRNRHRRAPYPSTAGAALRCPRCPSFPVRPPAPRQINKTAQQTRPAPPPPTATGEHPTR